MRSFTGPRQREGLCARTVRARNEACSPTLSLCVEGPNLPSNVGLVRPCSNKKKCRRGFDAVLQASERVEIQSTGRL